MPAARVREKGFVDGGGNRTTAPETDDVGEAFGPAGRDADPVDRDRVEALVHPATATTSAVTASGAARFHRDGDAGICTLTTASRSRGSGFEHRVVVATNAHRAP